MSSSSLRTLLLGLLASLGAAALISSCTSDVPSMPPAPSSALSVSTIRGDSYQRFSVLLAGDKLELVMSEGDTILATTDAGKIEVLAGAGLKRSYTWEGATRTAKLLPREERWDGSFGAYFPGPGEHWKNHNGITRGVLQEGQQHFKDKKSALDWLATRQKWYPTVFTNSGLAVSFGKVAERRQINVEVWQIMIEGKPPKGLRGADDTKVRFVKSKKPPSP
jgi:hypothetical protein